MNKREAQFYDSYVNSTVGRLEQVYGKCSAKKHEAFRRCLEIRRDDTYKYTYMYPLRIIAHNSYTFTVAWEVETCEGMYLHVVTPSNEYLFTVTSYV